MKTQRLLSSGKSNASPLPCKAYAPRNDRLGIIFDITHTISLDMCVNIRSFSLVSHDYIFDAELEIYVQNTEDLKALIGELKKIKGVETVKQLEQ